MSFTSDSDSWCHVKYLSNKGLGHLLSKTFASPVSEKKILKLCLLSELLPKKKEAKHNIHFCVRKLVYKRLALSKEGGC